MALRVLPKLLARVSSVCVHVSLPSLCPLLITQINAKEIVMRMCVCVCVASLYLVVKDALFPHLHAKLRPAQLKLVTIYIEKAMRQRQKEKEGGGVGVCVNEEGRRRVFGEISVQ